MPAGKRMTAPHHRLSCLLPCRAAASSPAAQTSMSARARRASACAKRPNRSAYASAVYPTCRGSHMAPGTSRAQVVTAWCHGHGIGDMAGCKTARDVCQADGCAGPAAQRLVKPARTCAAKGTCGTFNGTPDLAWRTEGGDGNIHRNWLEKMGFLDD